MEVTCRKMPRVKTAKNRHTMIAMVNTGLWILQITGDVKYKEAVNLWEEAVYSNHSRFDRHNRTFTLYNS